MRTQLLHKRSLAILFCILLAIPLWSQDSQRDIFSSFMAAESAAERFEIFFANKQKYTGMSAYNWKEKIEDIIDRINVGEDPLSKPYYQSMLCRIYYDLGDYNSAANLAGFLIEDDAILDVDIKRVVLGVADKVYFELKQYREQLKVRKAQERLGEQVELYTVYANMGLYSQALADYEIRNPRQKAEAGGNFNFAKYYKDRGDYKRLGGLNFTAIKEYEEALTLVEEYINIQGIRKAEDFREALFLKGQILGGIGKTMLNLNRYREAITYLEEGVVSAKMYEQGKFPYFTADYWTDLADCYLKDDQYDLAKTYIDSIESAGRIAPYNQMRVYHLKADYYLGVEEPTLASQYLSLYSQGKDSLDRNKLEELYLGQVVAFERGLETKRRLEKQKADLERNAEVIMERGKIIYLSIVALLFSLLCVVALIIAYLKSVKNKKLIENQKLIIENSLTEKDSLLKEIHHRVKNNLQMVSSLLSLQSKNTRSRAAINALEEGQSRVKAMALIHQKLYQNDDLSVIEMQEYIESLVASIHSVFKKEGYQTNIHINAEQTKLDVDRAIPIGLILNELVSNSFKYAFAENKEGNIYISLENKGEEYAFEYKDDGKGLPEDFEQTSVGSMGLRLIRRLANQLRSNLQIDTKNSGARFWFNFG